MNSRHRVVRKERLRLNNKIQRRGSTTSPGPGPIPGAFSFVSPVALAPLAFKQCKNRKRRSHRQVDDWLFSIDGTRPPCDDTALQKTLGYVQYWLRLVCSDSPSAYRDAERPQLPFALEIPTTPYSKAEGHLHYWPLLVQAQRKDQGKKRKWSSSSDPPEDDGTSAAARWRAIVRLVDEESSQVIDLEALAAKEGKTCGEYLLMLQMELEAEFFAAASRYSTFALDSMVLLEWSWSLVPESEEFARATLPMLLRQLAEIESEEEANKEAEGEEQPQRGEDQQRNVSAEESEEGQEEGEELRSDLGIMLMRHVPDSEWLSSSMPSSLCPAYYEEHS